MFKQGLSLSFLDVMTCSLGAMLLLFFFVAVAMQDAAAQPTKSSEGDSDSDTPFVLIVYARDDQPLFESTPDWSLDNEPTSLATEVSLGEQYAVFYFRRKPQLGSRVQIGPLSPGACVVQGIHHGEREFTQTLTVATSEAMLQVWPPVRASAVQ